MGIRVGVIGCGRIANAAHLPNYAKLDDVEVAALCDIDKHALEETASKYNVTQVFVNAEDILSLETVDAVSICTPNVNHGHMTLTALEKGKHVLCEKPMAMNADEASRMVKTAQDLGLVNMVSFTHRFNPTMVFIQTMIGDGRLGRLYHYRVQCSVDRIMNPDVGLEWRLIKEKSGTGVLADLASHMVDLSTFLMGDHAGCIREVTGMSNIFINHRRLLDSDGYGEVTTDDATAFVARYERGVMGVFEASRFAPSGVHIEINGSGGSIIYDSSDMNAVQFRSEHGGNSRKFAREEVPPFFLHRIGYTDDMFYNEIRTFVEAVKDRRQIKPDFTDGLACQSVLDAVYESTRDRTLKVVE